MRDFVYAQQISRPGGLPPDTGASFRSCANAAIRSPAPVVLSSTRTDRSPVKRLGAQAFGHDAHRIVAKAELQGEQDQGGLLGRNSVEVARVSLE